MWAHVCRLGPEEDLFLKDIDIYLLMPFVKTSLALSLLASAGLTAVSFPALAEASQTAPASTARLLGTVTAVSGDAITIKSDAGVVSTITVSDATRIVRTEPGQKDLSSATPIKAQDLTIGDRVLVRATPGSAENTYSAQAVIAMKKSDIAQKQQQDREDWQKRGLGGIVKSVDAAAGTVVVTAGSRTYTIHTTPKTIVRRYAPDSVKFDDAKVSSLDQIKPGDQLRARGDRNTDGTEVNADEIVAGSFRNIAAMVASVNTAGQTLTVTDLITKKPVVVRFTPDSQLHKLAPEMAQGIAARFKGASGGSEQPVSASAQPVAGNGGGMGSGRAGGQRGDLSQMLQRAPSVQLTDLHPGDAVMIVATEGASDTATAITLLAGVEPMLQASTKASQSLFSSSWSLGGGGDSAAAAQQ
ncbi:hypothetical protein H7849_25680 [Alloacidobacterium dinghuense]|uniref:DUF5666 domain-containing protein n=1 Tax=Alloacidobacterium dinghuense TaxID=2763107 RepID=A0A7G8BIF8_9BACT|nr:hypothetical protein [Alloacidobacterium dinghuense]QNI32328.1 hypothetical protein H7849_25680 [Alloacidobacterium dinghuense]